MCRDNRLVEINIDRHIRKDQAVNHNSINENLGKSLKAEKARRRSYGIKISVASAVLVAAIMVAVFL